MTPIEDHDQPWIVNYPELHGWLEKYQARCDWQLTVGDDRHASMWRIKGSMPFIIVVLAGRRGWNIYTPPATDQSAEIFRDTTGRIFQRKKTVP